MDVRIPEPHSAQTAATVERLRQAIPTIDADYASGLAFLIRQPRAGEHFEPGNAAHDDKRYLPLWVHGHRKSMLLTYTWHVDDFGLVVTPVGLYEDRDFDRKDAEIRKLVGIP